MASALATATKKTEQLSSLSHFQQHSEQLTLEQALAYYLEQKGKTRGQLFQWT